jgi:hypothetical protein
MKKFNEAFGRGVARRLDINFIGIQNGIDGKPLFACFIDPVTGTTVTGVSVEDTADKIRRSRQLFKINEN